MARRDRFAFTLTELLVVITIIGMLAALLMPAVLASREKARMYTCMTNQKELGTAVTVYESAKQAYPGYMEIYPGRSAPLTWALVLLPYLGRGDIWAQWADATNASPPVVFIAQLLCPDDPRSMSSAPGVLSYVANCGMQDDTRFPADRQPAPDYAANGIFQDHSYSNPTPLYVSSTDVKDGTQYTLLLSENLQATKWYDANASTSQLEAGVGMIWSGTVPRNGNPQWIDQDKTANLVGATYAVQCQHARPSSNHNGGVVVTYCDGHTAFLRDVIDYRVYAQLMAPSDADVLDPVQGNVPPICASFKPLTDSDINP